MEFVPEQLEAGVLYVALNYATASHRCCCGCGREVVTPLSPTDWKIVFDGENVSLYPSIGNWDFPCRSHYWVRDGRVDWAGDWSPSHVRAATRRDDRAKEQFYRDRARDAGDAGWWSGFWRRW